jgi:hypothetical protein
MVSEKAQNKVKVAIRIGELVKERKGYLRLNIAEDSEIDVNDIEELFIAGKELMNDQPYCLLTDARNYLTATSDAREYAAKNLKANKVIANALLTGSFPVVLIVNFYIRINRPEVPTQMFRNESNAIHWLNSFLENEEK